MSRDEDDTLPGRPGYEITQESRFADESKHPQGCACGPCVDRERCAKCGHRGGRTDCSICKLRARPPAASKPNYYQDNPLTRDVIPRRGENYMGPLRYNGQRLEHQVRVKKACAKCGHAHPDNLRQVGETYECLNKHACESMVRVSARLHLVKVEPE